MLLSLRHALGTAQGCVCPVRSGAGASAGPRGLRSPHTRPQLQVRGTAVRAPGSQQDEQQQQSQPTAQEGFSHSNGSAAADGAGSLVRFKAYFTAQFGDTVKVVGSAPELGAWDPTQALSLTWAEGGAEAGDLWTADVQLATGDCDFKVIVQTPSDVLWEPGENRAVEVPELLPSEVLVAELVYGKQELMAPPVAVELEAAPAEAPAEAEQATAAAGAADAPIEEATAAEPAPEPAAELAAQPVPVQQEQQQAPEADQPTELAVENTAADVVVDVPVDAADTVEVAQAPEAATDAETAGTGLTTMFDDSIDVQSVSKEDVAKRAEAELEQHTQAISLAAAIAAAATAAGEPAPPARAEPAIEARAAPQQASTPPAAQSEAPARPTIGGAELFGAVLGTAAVATVLYSEYVLKQTGCGLPPGPSGLIGAAEGVSYLAVVALAGTGTVQRAQGKGGLSGALVLPELLAYVAIAVGLGVLYLQVQEHGYIPPVLPGGACYADNAPTSLPSLPSFSMPSLSAPSS